MQRATSGWVGVASVLTLAVSAAADPGQAGLPGAPPRSEYAKRVLARAGGTAPGAAAELTEDWPAETPGAISRHGVGGVLISLGGDEPVELYVFASRLTYSGRVRAVLVNGDDPESVTHGLADALRAFGGAPETIELNAPTGCAELSERGETIWDPRIETWIAGAQAAAPGARLRAVRLRANWVAPFSDDPLYFVEDSFFARFDFAFADRADLEKKLAAWHRWANREHRFRGAIPDARYAAEQAHLRPVPAARGAWTGAAARALAQSR